MSKTSSYLEAHGWRLYTRRKHGMYIKERWYHPSDGTLTYNQAEAMATQRYWNKAKKAAKAATA